MGDTKSTYMYLQSFCFAHPAYDAVLYRPESETALHLTQGLLRRLSQGLDKPNLP